MIVHAGGKASGFKNVADSDSYDTDGVSLYHVKGEGGNGGVAGDDAGDDAGDGVACSTMTVQVDEKAENLNSGDCFVLLTAKTMFVWQGVGSDSEEREAAQYIAKKLQNKDGVRRELMILEEDAEPEEFWAAFDGGKAEYPKSRPDAPPPLPPRLFQCSNMIGVFKVWEVQVKQEELNDDDVMLLDTGTTLFVWLGQNANEKEKTTAIETAAKLVRVAAKYDATRNHNTPVVQVRRDKVS
jgi:hypothetical protein